MKNLFLIISIIASFLYCYGYIIDNELLSRIGYFTIAPALIIHYLINRKNKLNIIYIVAILFSYAADLNFYNDDINANVLSVGGFIVFNFLMTIIVFEKMNVLNFRRTILASILITSLFMGVSYLILGKFDETIFVILIYSLSLSLLVTMCFIFYKNKKTKESLFFLLGAISYVIASVFAELLYVERISLAVIAGNIFTYLLNNYFYTRAMLSLEPNIR